MRFTILVALGILPSQGFCNVTTFKHFFAYGDQHLVELARHSGADPTAEIGREIPTNVSVRVPVGNREFSVQYWMQYVSGPRERVLGRALDTAFVFDRSVFTDEAVQDINVALGTQSFRKLAPSIVSPGLLGSNFVNGAHMGAWINPDTMLDDDGDGVPDQFTYGPSGEAIVGAANGTMASVLRPIGLHATIRGRKEGYGPRGTLYQRGVAVRVMDIKWRADLSVGEQFGTGSGETGLGIHTFPGRPSPTWTTTHVLQSPQYYDTDPDWINIGAKYNLIGAAPVPEPASALALGLATLALLRRRPLTRPPQ